jgi:hypothetical protein
MKKKIAALYGAGSKSLLAERVLRRYVPNIVDPYLVEGKQDGKIGQRVASLDGSESLLVISPKTLENLYKSKKCDLVIIPGAYSLFDLREIRSTCGAMGFPAENIYTVPWNRIYAPLEKSIPALDCLIHIDEALYISVLDVHVVDHCNLRCKACAHFSNCVENDTVYSPEFLYRNLKHLQTLVPDIRRICILGGEPLLHPNLDEIIVATRDMFPYADLLLITNGLLLENVSPGFHAVINDEIAEIGVIGHSTALYHASCVDLHEIPWIKAIFCQLHGVFPLFTVYL